MKTRENGHTAPIGAINSGLLASVDDQVSVDCYGQTSADSHGPISVKSYD